MSELEEQKKLLLPILQRAEEIQNVEPKVAYYCRFYAIEQGLRMPKRAKEIDQLIMSTLAKLEKDKPALRLDPASDAAYCEEFALNIFRRADRVDRAGKADEKTCKAYYAASVFMDVCNQFGELASDLVEKQRYGLWRAAEIRKALREGRPALPPGGDTQAAPATLLDLLPPPAGMPPEEPGSMYPGPSGTPGDQTAAQTGFPSVPPPSNYGASTPDMPQGHAPPPPPPPSQMPAGPRFKPGDRVMYCESGAPPFHKGTVGMVSERMGDTIYRVALPTHIVEAGEGQLALDVPPGSSVMLSSSSGAPPSPAVVLAVITTSWPPKYLVKGDGGGPFEAPASQVLPLSQPQQQPGFPLQTSSSGSGYPPMPHLSNLPPPPAPETPSAPSFHSAPTSMQPTHQSGPTSTPPFSSHHQVPPQPPAPTPPMYSAPLAHHTSGSQPFPQFVAGRPSLQDITDAQKAMKYAASSLSFEDIPSAVKYLTGALELLTKP